MTRALAYKEIRENAGIFAVGLLALFTVTVSNMDLSPATRLLGRHRGTEIPFLGSGFLFPFGLVAGCLAVALGFRQSLGDFLGDAQLFLYHRPVRRGQIFGAKLAVGLAAYFSLGGAAILAYSVWAALPGTHPSPFEWSMTVPAWTIWLAISTVYLGSFLSGMRPAAWLGTRLAPLAAATGLAFVAALAPAWIGWPALIASDAMMVALILYVAQTRDFA